MQSRGLGDVYKRQVLERLSWRVLCPTHVSFRFLTVAEDGPVAPTHLTQALSWILLFLFNVYRALSIIRVDHRRIRGITNVTVIIILLDGTEGYRGRLDVSIRTVFVKSCMGKSWVKRGPDFCPDHSSVQDSKKTVRLDCNIPWSFTSNSGFLFFSSVPEVP